MDNQPVGGNSCIFCMFLTCNLSLLLVGLASASAGIAACVETGNFSWYSGSFVMLGIFTSLLGVLGHKVRYSIPKLTFHLVCVFVVFVLQLGFTIGIISYSEYDDLLGEESANGVRYTLLIACIIIFCCFWMGFFYRRSLHSNQWYNREESLMKNSMNASKETPKTDSTREEMYKKYPQLKDKNKA